MEPTLKQGNIPMASTIPMMPVPQMMPVQLPSQAAASYQMPPQVNAVKIDIIEPKAYGGIPQQQPQQIYNYPINPYYSMPQASQYELPQASSFAPQQPVIQQFPTQPVIMQPPVMVPPYIPPMPVPPPPSVIDQQPAPQQVQQPQQTQQPVEQPQIQQAPTQSVTPQPAVDFQSLGTALQSENLDDQSAAIQKIAEVAQSGTEQAQGLLVEPIIRGLTSIIVRDTSNLAGPVEGQKELSQREKAEMNKQFGTYTLAILQKIFKKAVDEKTKAEGLQTIPINDIPGIAQVVENVKGDPNPVIRESSISALSYLAQPDEKGANVLAPADIKTLATVFDIASKQDPDQNVKTAAQDALNKLPKV